VTSAVERVSRKLSKAVGALEFGDPVDVVYNPLEYAWKPHRAYIRRYARPGIRALLLGMNPGPWGMAQTGVPFGEVEMVRSFLGIEEPVGRPTIEHQFFDRFFIWNDCPLSFMESSGKNRTPDKLPADEREPLYAACDAALRSLVDILQPSMVVGVGAHATKRLSATLAERIEDGLEVGTILHPSPASPAANRGWAEAAERQMTELGLLEGV
jgi:single-strand selective monofunctional uracil DNA glycosylase